MRYPLALDRQERRALEWLKQQGGASEFGAQAPCIQLMERLDERGMVCSRLLEPHPRLANIARARYRVTWLGRAALKLAV